jgi:hypothetical protein
MAWIESHTNLARHPKTRRLCRILNLSVPAAVGHLHLFWHWVLEFAPSGILEGYSAEDIADGAYWTGDPDQFIEALIAAGFLENDGGMLVVHDWRDYAGRLLADRERKRSARRANEEHMSDGGTPPDGPETSVAESADETATVRGASTDVPRNVHGQSTDVPRNVHANRNRNHNRNHNQDDIIRRVAHERDPAMSSSSSSTDARADFEAVVEAWNRLCARDGPDPRLPEVIGPTKARRQKFALRCRELARILPEADAVYGLEFWERLFSRVRASPFLRGESDSGWQASLDWLLDSAEHVVRVLEGAYDRRLTDRPPGSRGNGIVTPERLAELERLYGASDLSPSEIMRREREAIRARKEREGLG